MSCVSNNPAGLKRPASGFSLLELLVAITITLLFVSAVYVTFVQISKGHQAADARDGCACATAGRRWRR